MDSKDWHAVIHGVTKSRTRLSDGTELTLSNLTTVLGRSADKND